MAVPTSKIRPDKKAHNFGEIGGYGWRAAYPEYKGLPEEEEKE